MKAIAILALASVLFLTCSQQPPKDESATRRAEGMARYQENLKVINLGLQAFQDEQIETWAEGVSDSCVWNSAMYGSAPDSKDAWKRALTMYITEFDSIRLTNAIFLPGVDTARFEPDGSVRYYGTWQGIHKSGVRTKVNFYGSYEFNAEHKIVSATDFFDVSGMFASLAPKPKP